MPTPIRILILEDRPADVELILHELRRAGFEPDWTCVQTGPDFQAHLQENLDVILADYSLPQFDGSSALRLVQESGWDIPFIIVTGSISEEVAVECIKQGAADYLLKDRLARLGPATTHALQEKQLRDEKRQAEAALRQREALFRSLIENVSDVIIILDEHGAIGYVSPSIERVLGHQPEGLSGRSFYDFVHPDDGPKLRAISDRASAGPARAAEIRSRHGDGSWRVLEAIANDLPAGPAMAGVVVTLRDITNRKRLEEQLSQSQKMEAIGRLAGGIAHDFNNLLVAVVGYSDLLLHSLSPLDPLYKDVEEIRKAGERATSLTQQLLSFSRKQVLQPKVLDLNARVVDMGNLLRRLIGENIELVTILDPQLGAVRTDPGQIGQVIMNLVVNARDAMPQGGRLVIETANVDLDESYARRHVAVQPGPYVMLTVSDTGAGMDEETRSHLFEPFFTTKEDGTGMGLSTVYGIVRQSGGHISVYSEAGQGTTFRIYLPRATETAEAADRDQAAADSVRSSGTILLVEDNDMVRNLVHRILAERGYTVLEASDPNEAFLLGERYQEPIHLLVTDVVMPGMSGCDLAERLAPAQPEMKVLYVSGYTNNAIARHGILDPGVAFLQKPFSPDTLVHKVRQVLNAPRPGSQ